MPVAGDQGKKPSIHISEKDAENAEKIGKQNKSPSTVYSEALEQAVKWQNLQQEKEKELKKQIQDLRDMTEKYSLGYEIILSEKG